MNPETKTETQAPENDPFAALRAIDAEREALVATLAEKRKAALAELQTRLIELKEEREGVYRRVAELDATVAGIEETLLKEGVVEAQAKPAAPNPYPEAEKLRAAIVESVGKGNERPSQIAADLWGDGSQPSAHFVERVTTALTTLVKNNLVVKVSRGHYGPAGATPKSADKAEKTAAKPAANGVAAAHA